MFGRKKKSKLQSQEVQWRMFVALDMLGVCLSNQTEVPVVTCGNERDLEARLNEFCEYIFGDSRWVHFHPGRGFPYLHHLEFHDNADPAGLLTHYTEQDFLFLWVVKQFLQEKKKGAYQFIDMGWLKENAKKTDRDSDCPISEMPADFLYW